MAPNSAWQINWAENTNGWGVTEGGSSGSPLFRDNGLIIGTLTGGSSSCTNQTSSDVYGRFSYHWTSNGAANDARLQPWLDPSNTSTTLPGYDPYATAPPEVIFYADRYHIFEGDAVNFTDASISPSGPVISWVWTLAGGTPSSSTDENPTNIIYNTAGAYDVSLSATNTNGTTPRTETGMINVIDPTITSCNTYSQWCCNATIYSTAEGYVGGSNEDDCQEIAEYFSGIYPYNTVSGFTVYFANVVNATNPDVTFKIYSDNSGQPGMLLASTTVPLSTIETAYTTDGYYEVVFPESVSFPDNAFFAGFSIPQSLSSGDIIAVATNDDADSEANTGYSLYNGFWETYSSWGMSLQNMIFPNLCFEPNLAPQANFTANPRVINAGASVDFTDLSYGGTPTSWSWTFDGGAQGTSNIQNPTITYNTPGIYSVSLTVSNANGNTSKTVNNYIKVVDPNTCSCSQLGNVVGSEVLYTVAAGGYLAGYNQYGDLAKAEYFDDGIIGNLEGAYFSFGAATVTNSATDVTFNVYDDSGTGSTGGTVTYSPGILIGTTTVPLTTIANNVTNGDSTYVAFDPPITITGNFFVGFDIPSPTSVADAIGLRTGAQDVGTDKGWEKSSDGNWYLYSEGWGSTFNNAIYPVICTEGAPLPEFAADNTNIVTGTTVNFTDMSTCGPTSWSWTFDGGTPATSTNQNPSVMYDTPGIYAVSLVVSNASGTNPIVKTGYITVSQAPDNIVLWDFPNNPDNNIADDGIAPNLTRTITGIGGLLDIQYNAPGVATSSVGAENWGSGIGSKGWQVDFETLGYGTLKLNFAQMSDNAGSPRDFKVQYSTNGTVWTDLVASYQLTEDVWKQQNNIVLPVACENQANVYLRWIMTSNTSVSDGTVQNNSTTRRNYMDNILVTGFPLNAAPVADFTASSTTICEGESITFTDASTNTPTSWSWSFAGGTPATSTDQNPVVTYAAAGTYQVELTATNASGSDTETKAAFITVNPNVPASVSIVADQNDICAGTNVTFTATPTNGGTPSYSWRLNGVSVGGNSPTYSNNTLANGNTVTCVMTSTATCATGSPATSNAVNMIVNPILPVSVTIVADQNNICDGTNVTFTATPTNGGTPTYEWFVNGTSVGNNSPIYTNNALINGAAITCEMTSSEICVSGNPATSNTVNMTVDPILPVSVSIVADQNNICDGTNVTFTATPTNGGTPTYQWKINGGDVGTNSPIYSNNTLNNGDNITCVMTSSETCVSGNPATSNAVNITVNPVLPASVSIVADQNNICASTNVTFTATPINGGATPTYQWKIGSVIVGGNSPTYSNNSLANGNNITCVMTSSETCVSGNPATSNAVSMVVNPILPISVSIVADQNNICDGTNVTFSATPTNGGTPTYQWKLNGGDIGTNSPTYSNNALNNGDNITCVMTSSLACVSGNPATSNAVSMVVNPILPVSVSIVADQNNICDGTNVTFTATPTNGGTPTYQWKLNGGDVGTNSPIYSNNTLNNGDVVSVEMTSSLTCLSGNPATSNAVTMTVNPNLPVSVSISANQNNICFGTNVTFTATPTNGGATPTYQWKIGSVIVGANSPTYSSNTLSNGNSITCVMTSSETCVSGNPATSNVVSMIVNPILPVSVSILADQNNICDGTNVTFTATPTNGGTPTYQWKLNGGDVGANSPTYSNNALNNSDNITCVMTSSETCVSGNPATSNAVNMIVNPILPVSVSILADQNNICDGTNVTFTATPTNGGTPTYQWKLNGGDVGANTPTYSNNALNNSDNITCVMTSSETCVSGNPATSNAVNMVVNPILPISVSIIADQNNICAGTNVTFTATPINGGTPTYQWKRNGGDVGANSPTYSNNALNNSDNITCVMTSSETCVSGNPATSNAVSMVVNPILPVSVSIVADQNNICDGTNVTFSATPTNGGTPAYQWKLNGGDVGTGTTFSSSTLNNTDVVTVEMASSLTCVSGSPATSNSININILPATAITVQPSDATIGDGGSTSFGLTAAGDGLNYQWQVSTDGGTIYNNIMAAGLNPTYANWNTATLNVNSTVFANNGYLYQCIVTGTCTPIITSNPAELIVNSAPAITTQPINTSVCTGTSATFTVVAAGTITGYQWQVSIDGGATYNNILVAGVNPMYSNWNTPTLDLAGITPAIDNYMYRCIVQGTPDAVSNSAVLTVNIPPVVTSDPSNSTICEGGGANFAINTIGDGLTYQWQVSTDGGTIYNNILAAGSNPTYANWNNADLLVTGTTNGNDGYMYQCVVSGSCAPVASSNPATMSVNPLLPTSVTITADQNNICTGTNVTFDATPTNGGTPSYQWRVNGTNVGTGATFSSSALNNSDVVIVEMTSSLTCVSGNPATSNAINMTVNPVLPASVTILASDNNVCDGTNITFTPTPVNGGTPAYHWKVNGANVGTGATFSSSTLNNADVVTVEMTSSLTCVSGNPATSNAINMIVNPILPASVSIVSSDNGVCEGTNITFTPNPVNGGIPAYQWKVNGANVGTGATFSSSTLNNADVVTVEMISSLTCISGSPATSDPVNMIVNPILDVDVSIAADNTTICLGSTVTFTATPVNGGTPTYVWYVNGVNIGAANSPTFSSSTLNDGDYVYCQMTSSETCVTNNPVTSNTIDITVNPNLPVSVYISPDVNPVCTGSTVTFTATPTNGGITPSYDWLVNTVSVGAPDSETFTISTLNNTDVVEVVLTSSESCATGNPATSNAVSMTVSPNLPVSVIIIADDNDVCEGTTITFTATPTNGGITPSYDWLVNTVSVGAPDVNTYSNGTLADGDVVEVVMTSSEACATGSPATSNFVGMIVNSMLTADVSISADITTICLGSTVTFTATPVNGGTPTYVWYVNGVNIGAANSPTFSSSTLNDGDYVYCQMTSSETCVTNSPATSNTETITVNSALPVSVSIATDANPVCDGSTVTFTATPTNGGVSPSYDWLVNSVSVGAPDSETFTINNLNDTDVVEVVLTSSESCATGNPAISSAINMTVNPILPASVSIIASDNNVCDGTNITFTANPTNGGVSPSYEWFIDGLSVGAPDLNTYTTNTLVNNAVVACVMTSSETCVASSPATSNPVNMTVNPILDVEVSIAADITTICLGSTVTFTATPVNGGTVPSYVWFVNDVNIGAPNMNTFSTSTLNDGDYVYCQMTSSEVCVVNSPATSNTLTVDVNPTPTVPIVDVQCVGTGIITVTEPVGAGYTYSIDGLTFQSETQFVDVVNGTYTLTVDLDGCTNVSTEFTVDCACENPPSLTLSTTDGIACNNANFVLSGNTFGGDATEVTLTHDGNGTLNQLVFTSSPFEIVYTPSATDLNTDITFTVTTDFPAGGLCSAATDQFVITVHEAPVVDLPETVPACAGEEFTYTLVGTYDYVLWMDAIEEQDFTNNYSSSGDYEVWVYVENEFCSNADTMTVVVSICSDIHQALNNSRFEIYPNPTRNNCQLSIDNYKGELNYSLIDIQGKVIISRDLTVKSEQVEDINIEDLVPGMYFIRLTTEAETINFKLIKN